MATDGATRRQGMPGSTSASSCLIARPRFKPTYAAAAAVLLAATLVAPIVNRVGAVIEAPSMVTLQSRPFSYRLTGEFTRDGRPLIAPRRTAWLGRALTIMVHQVTVADYERCVLDNACQRVAPIADSSDRPVVKVSWQDATAYAAWLSRQLGETYRLPTDEEWAFAAGSRFGDNGGLDGAVEPGQRLLQRYELEADRDDPLDASPRAINSFGANENGIFDFAGNVWEWTDTCYVHHTSNTIGIEASITNCGVRVVEGRHRTYMSDFIRDPRTGGCAVGKPPLNLGFRLVRELP